VSVRSTPDVQEVYRAATSIEISSRIHFVFFITLCENSCPFLIYGMLIAVGKNKWVVDRLPIGSILSCYNFYTGWQWVTVTLSTYNHQILGCYMYRNDAI